MTARKEHHRLARNGDLRVLTLENIRAARRKWTVSVNQIVTLKTLTAEMRLSVTAGDLNLLDGGWYITHAGLLRTAQRRRCHGIRTSLQKDVSDPIASRWVFKATVYKTPSSRGFVGYGDADPTNVSALVRGAEMRMAETRAVDRALRKAYGIGFCRRAGIVFRSTKVHRRIAAFEWRQQLKRFKQRPPSTPGLALPFNPEVRA